MSVTGSTQPWRNTGQPLQNVGNAASTFTGTWAGPAANQLLRQDVKALQEGELGLSEQEKDTMASKQQTLAGQQIGAQQEEINRQQLGSGGGFAGQYAEMSQALGGQAAQAGAQAYAGADEVSRQLAEGRRAEILGRLERQQDRSRENQQWAIDEAQDFGGMILDYYFGGLGGLADAGGLASAGTMMG